MFGADVRHLFRASYPPSDERRSVVGLMRTTRIKGPAVRAVGGKSGWPGRHPVNRINDGPRALGRAGCLGATGVKGSAPKINACD
jgi:hypothetical protein